MKSFTVDADSKFHSDAQFTCVDVVFSSVDQVRSFIAALESLLSTAEIETVELSDNAFTGDAGLEANVYFHKPCFKRDDTDLRCLSSAADLIMRYQNG